MGNCKYTYIQTLLATPPPPDHPSPWAPIPLVSFYVKKGNRSCPSIVATAIPIGLKGAPKTLLSTFSKLHAWLVIAIAIAYIAIKEYYK